MSKFEVLCVTMNQKDFSKIKHMNIHSDVVFANQADITAMDEIDFEGHHAKMITTDTRGVGINRNLALIYAQGEICMFADDDVTYNNDMEERVLSEFEAHPDADIIIFHFDTDSKRVQVSYSETEKCSKFCSMPWATFRIAFRLDSVRKANLWFTTLFGGGCTFPSGEDSMWLYNARKKGLTFYVSKETIGKVSFETSTWFDGYNERYFYGKGAYCACAYPFLTKFRMIYYLLRYRHRKPLSLKEKYFWMKCGREGYKNTLSYNEWKQNKT